MVVLGMQKSDGDSHIMLADEHPEMDFLGPRSQRRDNRFPAHLRGRCRCGACKAIAAGATELRPLCDQFYGDRSGAVTNTLGPCLVDRVTNRRDHS